MKVKVTFETAQGALVSGYVDYPSLELLAQALNGRDGVPGSQLRCLAVEDVDNGKITLVNVATGYAKVYER